LLNPFNIELDWLILPVFYSLNGTLSLRIPAILLTFKECFPVDNWCDFKPPLLPEAETDLLPLEAY